MIGSNERVYEFLRKECEQAGGVAGPYRNRDIAARLGLSTTTTAFAVAALQEFGLIQRVRRSRDDGSVYRVIDGGVS